MHILAGFVLRPGRLDWRRMPGGRSRKRLAWLLMLVNLLLAIWMVLNAGYSFAVLLMFGSLLVVFLVNRRGLMPVMRGLLFSIVATVVLLLAFGPLLGFLSDLAQGTEYPQKLADWQASCAGDSAVGTVDVRLERYQRSLELFLRNPLIGVLEFDDLGKHAAYLDRFAQYGFFFG